MKSLCVAFGPRELLGARVKFTSGEFRPENARLIILATEKS